MRCPLVPSQAYVSVVRTEAVLETEAVSNPVGITTVNGPPAAACWKTKLRICPETQPDRVLLVMFAESAVDSRKVVTDPLDDGQVNVGVAENVVVTTAAAKSEAG